MRLPLRITNSAGSHLLRSTRGLEFTRYPLPITIMSATVRYTIYDTWAWLYNQTMGLSYAQSQLQTLDKLFLPHLQPQSQILDLCCGTGQLANLLHQRGYRVIGLDGSARMLDYARQNAPQSQFILADARDFSLEEQVDAVCSTSASLNHIMSLAELKQVFEQVYTLLPDGGIFFFDLNHHEQMQKWWKGKLAEGEINHNYAWGITPEYDSQARQGKFKVGIYQAPQNRNFNLIQPIKHLVYQLLSLKRLTRFRIGVLRNFAGWQPDWDYAEIDYPVRGYRVDEVKSALQETGFANVSVYTLDGGTVVDNNHSAYFVAKKGIRR